MSRIAGGCDPAEGWRAEEVVGQVEVRMVEEVEGLGPELKIDPFAKRRVLHQRDVHVLKSRPSENISARIAKRSRRGKRKGAVLNHCAVVGFESSGLPTRFGRSFAPKPRIDRPVPLLSISESSATVNGLPDLKRDDAESFPAAQDCRYPTIVRQILPPFSKRQRVRVTHRQTMTRRRNSNAHARPRRCNCSAESLDRRRC